ncbi:MAG TPA: hypothetical protein DHV48_17125 [Prolixibacteraceae bacterium]|nr:hypothetical protein [Prolixibacteraceae bacterium]
MKTILPLSLAFIFLFAGCNQDDLPISGEGLSVTIGERVVITAGDIDYYDLSTHFIYLKSPNSFLNEKLYRDSFQVYADGEKIYTGVFHSWVMSSIPLGPAIYTPVIFYPDYVVPIAFGSYTDIDGEKIPPTDPRSDARILSALKSHNQLHEGLQCEIRSVQFNPGGKVSLELELINNDSFNYYYLDPQKMGLGLFHYFTNGLSLWNPTLKKSFENHVEHLQSQSYDSWEMNWLSLINSHEKKTIWIHYTNFDQLPAGQYKLFFRFPGLSKVGKSELVQRNGRIWLGELDLSQDIQIK